MGGPVPVAPEIRFWRFVAPEPNCGCWLWMGTGTKDGYGHFQVKTNVCAKAHRFSYEMHKGPIPAGMQIDHKCKVRCCVNPDHLEAVTFYENQKRSTLTFTARYGNATHCIRGHEFTTENTRVLPRPNGRPGTRRICKEYERLNNRAMKAKLRAAKLQLREAM